MLLERKKKGWRKSKYVLIELTSFHVNGLKRESKELVVEEKYGYEMKKNQADTHFNLFLLSTSNLITKPYLWCSTIIFLRFCFPCFWCNFMVLLHFWILFIIAWGGCSDPIFKYFGYLNIIELNVFVF